MSTGRTSRSQFAAMFRYGLLMELRSAMSGKQRASASRKRKSGKEGKKGNRPAKNFLFPVMLVLTGLYAGTMTAVVRDITAATYLLHAVVFIYVFLFVLVEYPTLVAGPEHAQFYGARPVSARIFLASTFSVIAVFCSSLGLILALPSGIFTVVFRGNPAMALLQTAGSIAGAVLAALAGSCMYFLMGRFLPEKWVRQITAILQIFLQSLFFFVMIIINSTIRLSGMRIPQTSVLWMLPPGWTTSPVHGGIRTLTGIALYLAALLALVILCLAAVKSDYLVLRSPGHQSTKVRTVSAKKVPLLIRTPESSAIRLLFFRNLKTSPRMRSGLITALTMTVFYFFLVIFVYKAPLLDPFTPEGRQGFTGTVLIYLAMGLNVLLFRELTATSEEHDAGWILQVAPARRGLYAREIRRLLVCFILAPYIALMTAVFAFFTGNITHSLMHFAVAGLIILLMTDAAFFLMPVIPFTRPYRRGNRFMTMLGSLAMMALLPVILVPLVLFVYPLPHGYSASIAVLMLLAGILECAGPRIADRKMKRISG